MKGNPKWDDFNSRRIWWKLKWDFLVNLTTLNWAEVELFLSKETAVKFRGLLCLRVGNETYSNIFIVFLFSFQLSGSKQFLQIIWWRTTKVPVSTIKVCLAFNYRVFLLVKKRKVWKKCPKKNYVEEKSRENPPKVGWKSL